MATSLEFEFNSWLASKLQSLNTDESVFGSYITGILTGDESLEEKTEALEGILCEITEGEDLKGHCKEILDRWNETVNAKKVAEPAKLNNEEVEEKLVKLLETNTLTTTVQRSYTEEERKIREAILSQYAETSDREFTEDDESDDECKENGLVKNMNASSVAQAEKEKREKAKVDSHKKKEKDKEDREKQKQQQADKKEKRKTQKQERRR